MKKVALAGVLVTLTLAAALTAQDPPQQQPAPPQAPQMPMPTDEHAWLQQGVGEWDTEGEILMGPGQPSMKCKGSETVRAIGPFWTVSEGKTTVMDMPMTGVLTLGYDPAKKKYVGSWVDSMSNHLWTYEGTVDKGGTTLSLNTEGPNPMAAGKMTKFKEVLEFKSKDHKVFTSSMQMDDGTWVKFVTINATRKK